VKDILYGERGGDAAHISSCFAHGQTRGGGQCKGRHLKFKQETAERGGGCRRVNPYYPVQRFNDDLHLGLLSIPVLLLAAGSKAGQS
jgi:hypothetical protein